MVDDDGKPITLSREDLYQIAWSKPMSELAKDFGISDVALAKRCKRLGIPLPGRGYWARIEPDVLDRAPLSADRVLRAAPELGWVFDAPLALRRLRGSLAAEGI
jgi:hypothetical protein